jgi:1-acyl-sn-glycerol-3-phosphate acyltransferase
VFLPQVDFYLCRQMKNLRGWIKLVIMVLILIGYTLLFYLVTFFKGKTVERGFRFRARFCRQALRILGIKYKHEGEMYSKGPCLYVSNHRSLLDPLIQLGYIDAFIVSKAEVGSYPLLGKGAKETGIILVHRESQSSRKAALSAIEKTLVSGYPVLIYPEGTTHGGDLPNDFRRGAIELASQLGIPIVPVMIEYPDPSYYWVDGTFMEYFIGKFSQKKWHRVWGRIGQFIPPSGTSDYAQIARQQIEDMILEVRKNQMPER